MTNEQKQAIGILNKIKETLSDDDYFLLMDFIIKEQPQVVYSPPFPSFPSYPNPYTGTPIVTYAVPTSTTEDGVK